MPLIGSRIYGVSPEMPMVNYSRSPVSGVESLARSNAGTAQFATTGFPGIANADRTRIRVEYLPEIAVGTIL